MVLQDDPTLTQPQLWVNRTLQHMEDAALYNASGLLGIMWRTRATSPQISAMASKSWNSSLTSKQFWSSWVEAQFGIDSTSMGGQNISAVFETIDSFSMPIVTHWENGPGALTIGCVDMNEFSFVETLENLQSIVLGTVNEARYYYWLSQFRYMRAIASTGCAVKNYQDALDIISKQPSTSAQQALAQSIGLPARIELVNNATYMITQLQQTLSSPGDIGTYMNMASHSLFSDLGNGSDLVKFLNHSLPPDATPVSTYQGASGRIIIPVVRTTIAKEENLTIRVLILAKEACGNPSIYYRSLTSEINITVGLTNVAREVYTTTIPPKLNDDDFMYYINAQCGNEFLVFPAGAPSVMQTVVRM